MNKAKEIGGSIRVITRPIYEVVKDKNNKKQQKKSTSQISKNTSAEKDEEQLLSVKDKDFLDAMKGIVQVIITDYIRLCFICENKCKL